MKLVKASVLLLVLFCVVFAQNESKGVEAISKSAVKAQLEFLSSDWMEGRATAQKGGFISADYIASMFELYGLTPGGDNVTEYKNRQPETKETFFQDFSLIEYTPGDDQQLKLKLNDKLFSLKYKTDFNVSVGSIGIEAEGGLVFVGYGYTNKDHNYDDFEDVDVNGKIIVRLNGFPGHKDTASAAYKKFAPKGRYGLWYLGRDKNDRAEELGVLGIIDVFVDEDQSLQWAENYPLRFQRNGYEGDKKQKTFYDTRLSLPGTKLEASISRISLSKRVINLLLEESNINVEEIEQSIQEELEPNSFNIKNIFVSLKTSVDSRIVRSRNVVGKIEGKNPNEYIVLGAHYDHLGKYDGVVWNGADDNASGTVGVMSIARACMATGVKPEKTIIFCAWTGEEKGLLGSRYFADNFDEIKNIKTYLNYDMISRSNEDDSLKNKCNMTYTEAFPILKELSEDHIKEYKIDVDLNIRAHPKPRGGSDFSSFAKYDIPVYSFMAAFHDDYHKPSDEFELCDLDKVVNVSRLGFLNIWKLANIVGDIQK